MGDFVDAKALHLCADLYRGGDLFVYDSAGFKCVFVFARAGDWLYAFDSVTWWREEDLGKVHKEVNYERDARKS